MTTMWHVTDRQDFNVVADYEPTSDMGRVYGKGLFVTPNPELWHYLWRPTGRVFAAQIVGGSPQRLGFAGDDRDQFWIAADSYDEVSVQRVVPVEQAEREAKSQGYGFAMLAADAIDHSRICVVDHEQGWGNPTALCRGVTDGNPIKWTTVAWVKTGPMASRVCPECMEALR